MFISWDYLRKSCVANKIIQFVFVVYFLSVIQNIDEPHWYLRVMQLEWE